jgi:spore maturation protein CgeB
MSKHWSLTTYSILIIRFISQLMYYFISQPILSVYMTKSTDVFIPPSSKVRTPIFTALYIWQSFDQCLDALETDFYRLFVTDFERSTGGDSLTYQSGMRFSTFDRDNDVWFAHCAQKDLAGWWYKDWIFRIETYLFHPRVKFVLPSSRRCTYDSPSTNVWTSSSVPISDQSTGK